MDASRAWAEIDLDALTRNLGRIRARIEPGVALLLIAKADAYGHGAVPIAHHAVRVGVEALGVTTCAEALELRRAGVRARLVVLGPVLGEDVLPALDQGIEIVVPSTELYRRLEGIARRAAARARIHLKIDTGMNRLGMTPEEALMLLEDLQGRPFLALAGLMSHVAATDGARSESAHEQTGRFEALLLQARAAGLLQGKNARSWAHMANSACVLSGLRPQFDAVRIGAAAYGLTPDARLFEPEFEPVMSVRTRVAHLQDVAAGESVGYGGSWTARRASRLAILPVGYNDGVDWRLGNRGEVLVHGRRVPIVGHVSMDYTAIDVTELARIALGDRVTLLGTEGGARLRVEEIARLTGTVPYDVTCSIGKRVERVFLGAEPVPAAPRPSPLVL